MLVADVSERATTGNGRGNHVGEVLRHDQTGEGRGAGGAIFDPGATLHALFLHVT